MKLLKVSSRNVLASLTLAMSLLVSQPLFAGTQAIFYVSPSGNDSNSGTISSPFLTIGRAQTAVRGVSGSMTGDIIVYLRGGVYPLSAPLAASGGFDGNGNAYSADQLGQSVLWNGVTFPIGPANSPDALDNTTVSVAPGNYTSISLLGAASGP